MDRHEVEISVASILRRVEEGAQVEDDSFVELKAEWPKNFGETARRIAAHANAAGGREILWVIGADEKAREVRGATGLDAATWFDQVVAQFENRWAPTLRTVVVPWNDTTVVALLFQTEGAPFVVRHGDRLEVPWRGSTQTRSAKRHELLQILSPFAKVPDVELRSGRLAHYISPSTITPFGFRLILNVYFTPKGSDRVVLPFHRMSGRIGTIGGQQMVEIDSFGVDLGRGFEWTAKELVNAPHFQSTADEIIISGPCRFRLLASGRERPFHLHDLCDECVIQVTIRPAGYIGWITLRGHFITTSAEDDEAWAWLYVSDAILQQKR